MPLCKAAGEEGLQLSGGRCQNKPVSSGSPETWEGADPAWLVLRGSQWASLSHAEIV